MGSHYTFAPCIANIRDPRWVATMKATAKTTSLTRLMRSKCFLSTKGREKVRNKSVKLLLGGKGTDLVILAEEVGVVNFLLGKISYMHKAIQQKKPIRLIPSSSQLDCIETKISRLWQSRVSRLIPMDS